MKYQVVIESSESAVVKTTYLIKEFTYHFLAIAFDPIDRTDKKKKDTLRKYTFTSSTLAPPFARDDIRRYRVIRQKFHGEDDINIVIEATSLQEACDKFATPYNDVFEVVEEIQHPKFTPAPTATQLRKAREKAAEG